MISEAIKKIVNKEDLTYDEAYQVMDEIMGGKTTPTQNAAFLAALSTKNTRAETIDEIKGCAAAMRAHATPVEHGYDVLDIVGTGGDGSNSFNISTTSAFVIAAGGTKVAKHGNRAASSKCGTADCLEALGVNIDEPPELAASLLKDPGMCFLFAQRYHASMKYVGPIRKELGFRTVFNILGPITNPAKPKYMVLGVYDEALVVPLAEVISSLGVERAMVIHGQDGYDEISVSDSTFVCELDHGKTRMYDIAPEDFGIERATKDDVLGDTPQVNAKICRNVLGGCRGPKRDVVRMNAGAGLYVSGKASSMADGVELAGKLIDEGRATAVLNALVSRSNRWRASSSGWPTPPAGGSTRRRSPFR